MKGLQRDPAQRWQTGREYSRALDRALPDAFDDQQMSELMASLFEDKIAVTRSLLSSAQSASPSDLRLMTMMGDDPAPRELASDIVKVAPSEPTAIARKPVARPSAPPVPTQTERTEANLQPVATQADPATIAQLRVVAVEAPEREEPTTVMPAVRPPSRPALQKPRSRPELAESKSAAELAPPADKGDWRLYAVLVVLALALLGGVVALLADRAPPEDGPIQPRPVKRR